MSRQPARHSGGYGCYGWLTNGQLEKEFLNCEHIGTGAENSAQSKCMVVLPDQALTPELILKQS